VNWSVSKIAPSSFLSIANFLVKSIFLDFIVGVFMCFVGILYILVGRSTANKLANLKKSRFSESTLRAEFREADVDAKGTLTMAQFKALVFALGLDLNRREVEAAFLEVDSGSSGVITIDQFLVWWNETDSDDGVVFV
jgi:hypothetical protein